MTNAYIVQASSGEYSDRRVWPIAVYLDLADARRHADRASAEARRRCVLDPYGDDGEYTDTFKALVAEPNPYDALSYADDDERLGFYLQGIDYHVDTTRLFGEVPA